MTAEQLQTTLYDRMATEQQKFKSWLLAQPPDEILDHACEYSVREDILMELEPDDVLPEAQIRALLKSSTPLADVYRAWEKTETHHMEDVQSVMEKHADAVIQAEKARQQREAR